jgi:hypothetical protein
LDRALARRSSLVVVLVVRVPDRLLLAVLVAAVLVG